MVIYDIRDYIFPINIGRFTEKHGNEVFIKEVDGFLGAGFFISKNAISLTAAHCLPKPEDTNGKSVCAGLWDGKYIRAHKIISFIVPGGIDIAILKVDNVNPKYLPISFEPISMGQDVATVGIPLHSITEKGIGVRTIKGYVSFVSRFLELSFPAPRGLSGSPLFFENKVVGVICGNARSEALEDQVEEIIEASNEKEVIHIVETKSVINYSLAEPLAPIESFKCEAFGELSFRDFIEKINNE